MQESVSPSIVHVLLLKIFNVAKCYVCLMFHFIIYNLVMKQFSSNNDFFVHFTQKASKYFHMYIANILVICVNVGTLFLNYLPASFTPLIN